MKLYEYEGKEIFKLVGIPVPRGVVTDKPIKWDGKAIVKSQILEGGRGKKGLVRVTEDVYNTILELQKLGVSKFLVEEYIPHYREIYLSCLIGAIQDSFANCNISVDLDLFNGGIIEYI